MASLILLVPFFVSAHPGNTDSSGCHTCHTNCPNWGLSYEEYHCHNAKSYSQPLDPIRSHYGPGGTGWTETWPDYSASYSLPSIPSIPSCPLYSSYNSFKESCECYSNYVAKGDRCISMDDYCQDLLGFNAEYRILGDACGCRSGYVLNEGQTSCISGDSYCHNKYGLFSSYNRIGKACECDSGYGFDAAGTQCISNDTACRNLLGWNSKYDSLHEACGCSGGYILNSSRNQCIDGDSYCQALMGINSSYNAFGKNCECDSGYEMEDSVCIEELPILRIPPPPPLAAPLTPVIPPPTSRAEPSAKLLPTTISSPLVAPSTPSMKSLQKSGQKATKESWSDLSFLLIGNERLRGCPGFNCPVVKHGSLNGIARILEQRDMWYRVTVSEGDQKSEGWMNETLVPEDNRKGFASLSAARSQKTDDANKGAPENRPKRFYTKFLGWVTGIFH